MPNAGGYNDASEQQITKIIGLLETNERCRRAFEIVALQTINETVEKGVVIGPSTLLMSPANNKLMGIVEGARKIYNDVFGTSSARGATIRKIPGEPNPFLNPRDQRPRMFFSLFAFSGSFSDTLEDVVHEFMHAGGQANKLGWWPGGHDLSGDEWYDFLQESCKPE